MNPPEKSSIVPRTADYYKVTDSVVGEYQSTHSVRYRAERGQMMETDQQRVEYVSCVEVSGRPRTTGLE
jgi:hypothetical protein